MEYQRQPRTDHPQRSFGQCRAGAALGRDRRRQGHATLGADSKWSVPFYLDGGAGDSNHTWQVAAGIAYSFRWGEIIGMWRYLDYGLSGNEISSVHFKARCWARSTGEPSDATGRGLRLAATGALAARHSSALTRTGRFTPKGCGGH
jgi:hypothetical protein